MSRIADEFQPKLLSFRLHRKWKAIDLPSETFFTARTRDLATVLLSLVDDDELIKRVRDILRDEDWGSCSARNLEPQALVLTALYEYAHSAERRHYVLVGELAKNAERLAESYGEPFPLHARKVGEYLRLLGFYTMKVGNLGRGIMLTKEVRQKLHHHIVAYQVSMNRPPAYEDCPVCCEKMTMRA